MYSGRTFSSGKLDIGLPMWLFTKCQIMMSATYLNVDRYNTLALPFINLNMSRGLLSASNTLGRLLERGVGKTGPFLWPVGKIILTHNLIDNYIT